ncbi:MAG: 2-amino-4-ketopentanoate thiolase [Candidatus Riflebacteria bacterium]|nr:2-amino-4-ketopentanoate thiolase [Candidatus Riflebacteria bacterium]
MTQNGRWVEIEKIILAPEQRASTLPEDTAKTPYKLRLSGFLLNEGKTGDTVKIRTMIGREIEGTLINENPEYRHSFGETVQEILDIGLGEKL